MKAGIVLFAHGSRDRAWARPFEALAATLSPKFDGPVKLAYLELMPPSLEVLTRTVSPKEASSQVA